MEFSAETADVDLEREKLVEDLHQAFFGTRWNSDDQQIDTGVATEVGEHLECPELSNTSIAPGGAVILPVIENAENPHVVRRIRRERTDEIFGIFPTADDDCAPDEPARTRQPLNTPRRRKPNQTQEQCRHSHPRRNLARSDDLLVKQKRKTRNSERQRPERHQHFQDLRREPSQRRDRIRPLRVQHADSQQPNQSRCRETRP